MKAAARRFREAVAVLSACKKRDCAGGAARAGRHASAAGAYLAFHFYAVQEIWAVGEVPSHSVMYSVFSVKQPAVLDILKDSVSY